MKPKPMLLGMSIILALAAFLLLLPTPALAYRPGSEAKGQNQTLGGDILLSVHPYDDFNPAVAYNAPAGEFLVVWRNGSDVVGQRYLADGQPLGELFYLGDTGSTQAYPSVAYSLIGDRYLVVWEDNRNGYYDIYGQLVDAGGITLLENAARTIYDSALVDWYGPYHAVVHRPCWSPDDSLIGFCAQVGVEPDGSKPFDLFRAQSDGAGVVNVTNGSMRAIFVDWNPNWTFDLE